MNFASCRVCERFCCKNRNAVTLRNRPGFFWCTLTAVTIPFHYTASSLITWSLALQRYTTSTSYFTHATDFFRAYCSFSVDILNTVNPWLEALGIYYYDSVWLPTCIRLVFEDLRYLRRKVHFSRIDACCFFSALSAIVHSVCWSVWSGAIMEMLVSR